MPDRNRGQYRICYLGKSTSKEQFVGPICWRSTVGALLTRGDEMTRTLSLSSFPVLGLVAEYFFCRSGWLACITCFIPHNCQYVSFVSSLIVDWWRQKYPRLFYIPAHCYFFFSSVLSVLPFLSVYSTNNFRATFTMWAKRFGPRWIPPYHRETTTRTFSSFLISNK